MFKLVPSLPQLAQFSVYVVLIVYYFNCGLRSALNVLKDVLILSIKWTNLYRLQYSINETALAVVEDVKCRLVLYRVTGLAEDYLTPQLKMKNFTSETDWLL